VSRVLLFSLTAMFNPTLLAATTLMLLLPSPKKLMLGYLLGAMLTSVTLGMVIVFSLEDSGAVDTAKRTVDPIVDLAVGALLLVVALVLRSGRGERKRPKKEKGPPRWQRALSGGSAKVTFAVGVVLTLPGASYLAALTAVSKLDATTTETVLLVLMVNLIMLAILEIPLIGFFVAPERTAATVQRATDWFSGHARQVIVAIAAGAGTLLIVRGVIELISA
jgi:hypothetical protein